MNEAHRKFWRWGVPAALFALALLLRLPGIGWGLKNDLHNQSYHPDELPIWAASQQIKPAEFDFTPGFYNYGTLYLTSLRVASDAVAAYTGGPDPKNNDASWAYVSRCHMAGRIVSALAGSGCVLLIFLMMRRFTGRVGAFASAISLMVAPALVVHSRFQTVDVFATFLLVLSAYFALRLIPPPGLMPESDETIDGKAVFRNVVLASIFAGLSAGTKYTGVLGLMTIWTALFLCQRRRFWSGSILALVVTLIAFLVATPGAILDSKRFLADVGFEVAHSGPGHGLVFAGTTNGYIYHIGNLISGMGGLVFLVGLAGLGYATYRRHRWPLALLAFFLPYYLLIGHAQDKYMRYTFPLDLALAAGFGYAVAVGHRRRGAGAILVVLGILGVGGALTRTAKETLWMMGTDPRDAAARYLKAAARQEPSTVVGFASDPWYWSPPLFLDSAEPRSVPFDQRMQRMGEAQPRATYYIAPDGSNHPFDDRLITESKPTFVVFSSLEADPLVRLMRASSLSPEAQAASSQYRSFTDALTKNYSEAALFGEPGDPVEDMQYIQPEIYVWKRKP